MQAEEILHHFTDPQAGFFDTRDDHEALIARPKGLQDGPIPSGNTLATALLLRLHALTGETRYAEAVEKSLRSVQPYLSRYPAAFTGWLCEVDFWIGPQIQLALIGPPASPAFRALIEIPNQLFTPNLVMAGGFPEHSPQISLLEGRKMIKEASTAYLCQGFSCQLPTSSPKELETQLKEALHPS